MNTLCLLTEPLIRVQGPSGVTERLSLPQLLARLAAGEALDFPMLRPHQQPAWHAFLVQLAFLSLVFALELALELTDAVEAIAVPTDAATWQRLLRALTADHADDAPWCLVVDDWLRPAFLQSPCRPGAQDDYKHVLASAQEIDRLITSKNHDEKVGKMARLGWDDADLMVFALVSLQGFTGQLGRGNFSSFRMNKGNSSRAQFRLAFKRGSGPEFLRDLRVLLARTDQLWQDALEVCIGTSAQLHRLLWLPAWGDSALSLASVHPLCLEVCRRVRLRLTGDALQAITAGSKSARVDAKLRNGVVLDPWLPIVRDGEAKALTAIAESFGYRVLSPILFDAKRYKLPVLAMPCAEVDRDSAGVLVMQVLVGGQGKSEGLLRREIPMRRRVLRKFSDAPAELALRAGRFIEIASAMQGKVLRSALLQFVDSTDDPDWKNGDFGEYVQRWTKQFDTLVDEVFYEALFATVDAELADLNAEAQWLKTLGQLATLVFERALEALPSRDRSRMFARVRAEQMFSGGLKKQFGPLLAYTRAAAGTGTGKSVDDATAIVHNNPLEATMPTSTDASRLSDASAKAALRAIAAQLSSPGVNMGMLAALRRFNPVNDGQHNVFEVQQVLFGAGIDLPADSLAQPHWALVVHCLAIVRGAHDLKVDIGARLADLGLKEARVRQLVEADELLLVDLLPALARRVVAAGVTLNWWPLALLVLSPDDAEPTRGQEARREIVKGFIRATAKPTATAAKASA